MCDNLVVYTRLRVNYRVAHIINTATSNKISVSIPGSSGFGNYIGITNGQLIDRFECDRSGNIILIQKSTHSEDVVTVDRVKGVVLDYEIKMYGDGGLVTNRWHLPH